MEIARLNLIFLKLDRLPFYQTGNVFCLDEAVLRDKFKRVFEFADDLDDDNILSEADIEDCIDDLLAVTIPSHEFKTAYKTHKLPNQVVNAKKRIKRLKHQLFPLIDFAVYCPSLTDAFVDVYYDRYYANAPQVDVVLNKQNPFSDVTIKNQTYLCPGDDGHLAALSFKTGYTMTKVQGDASALALLPDFKITKNQDLNQVSQATITFSDEISTPIPQKTQTHTLYYM